MTEVVETIKEELAGCAAEASRQGWAGSDYEHTAKDYEWVADACRHKHGRMPTREEWEGAGVSGFGGKYCEE